jgi:hypothetical protein
MAQLNHVVGAFPSAAICPPPSLLSAEVEYWRRDAGAILDVNAARSVVDLSSMGEHKLYAVTRGAFAYRPPRRNLLELAVSGASPSWRMAALAALWRRIEGFARLPADWAGEGTVLVSPTLLNRARLLLRGLPSALPLPQASPSAEGEIALTWFRGGRRLEAMLQPDDHLVWVVTGGGRTDLGKDLDLSVDSASPFYEAVELFHA